MNEPQFTELLSNLKYLEQIANSLDQIRAILIDINQKGLSTVSKWQN